jgi:hypothetical protein
LTRIPIEARISVVTEKAIVPATEVRSQFKKAKRFKEFGVEKRGWMLDVLNVVRQLGKGEFTNQDIYALSDISRNCIRTIISSAIKSGSNYKTWLKRAF